MARNQRKFGVNLLDRIKTIEYRERAKSTYSKSVIFIKRRPMASFFIALGMLFLLIVANSLLTPKPKSASKTAPIKEV